jgi:hypothetical protein
LTFRLASGAAVRGRVAGLGPLRDKRKVPVKIYRRNEFLALPEGTFYAKGKPWYFGELSIKHDTSSQLSDWWSLDPCWIAANDSGEAVDRLDEMLEKGASYPMQDAISRDGLWDEDDLFLVFEKDDLLKLREMIDKAISL